MKKVFRVLVCALCAVLCMGTVGCNKSNDGKLQVYAPDGAPALALAGMMDSYGNDYDFEIVASNAIGNKVTTGAADIAVMPSNAAANLYNLGKDYRIAAFATMGNLYLVGKGQFTLDDLVGKRLGLFNMKNVPDVVMLSLLQGARLPSEVSDDAVEGKVALRYYADGAAVMQAIIAGQVDVGLIPEPAATAALVKIEGATRLDVQALRQEQKGSYGFPQAVLVVKNETYKKRKTEVEAFIDRYTQTGKWAEDNAAAAVALIKAHMTEGVQSSLADTMPAAAVKGCNIDTRRVTAADRATVEAFLNDVIAASPESISMLPNEDFYLANA